MSLMRGEIESYWYGLADVATSMPFDAIASAADMLLACHRRRGTIFVVGNGGSAATASHFACDLAKGTRNELAPAFRVMPLTDNVPLMTAWANDTSYDRIFAEQLSALVQEDDVVVLISASGNSPNVLAVMEVARAANATTIALTSRSGGVLGQIADLTIHVPTDDIEHVEDAHLAISHSLCVVLRRQLRVQAALAVR